MEGGALAVEGKANVEIDSCTLTNNRAGLPFIHRAVGRLWVSRVWMLDYTQSCAAIAISAG